MLTLKMKKKLLTILRDDVGKGDVTSVLLKSVPSEAKIFAKESSVVAGLEEAKFLFSHCGVKATGKVKDGQKVRKGAVVLCLHGPAQKILEVERTALNVLGRMSEVATTCAEAKKIAGKVTVALTRKTMPGFNLFDKKAGKIAGIWTHRLNLEEFVLLKDTHLPFFDSASDAVLSARKNYRRKLKIEIEVESLKQAFNAARAKPDIIMLDNLSPKQAKAAIKKLRSVFNGKIELSGGVSLKNLKDYAAAKPDIISMGSLTYATKWRDFSLKMRTC